MVGEEILQFNVYAKYFPRRREENFYVESTLDGESSRKVNREKGGDAFESLDEVGGRIFELIPSKNQYEGVIFEDGPIWDKSYKPRGIRFNQGGSILYHLLSIDQQKQLLHEIDRRFEEEEIKQNIGESVEATFGHGDSVGRIVIP